MIIWSVVGLFIGLIVGYILKSLRKNELGGILYIDENPENEKPVYKFDFLVNFESISNSKTILIKIVKENSREKLIL